MTDGSERNQSSSVSGTSDGSGATEGAMDQKAIDRSGKGWIKEKSKEQWIREQLQER
jgi:hypothetical protein